MITGRVTTDREAIIHVTVHGDTGQEHKVDAVIDTGFDGWLSLPPALINRLELPWCRRGRAQFADGREGVFDIYSATVIWDRWRLRFPVDEADTFPLVGMDLMNGYELNVQVCVGGKVTIKQLRRREN